MPKHDEPSGKGRYSASNIETENGTRLFVWDKDGQSHGVITWALAFERGFLGPARFVG